MRWRSCTLRIQSPASSQEGGGSIKERERHGGFSSGPPATRHFGCAPQQPSPWRQSPAPVGRERSEPEGPPFAPALQYQDRKNGGRPLNEGTRRQWKKSGLGNPLDAAYRTRQGQRGGWGTGGGWGKILIVAGYKAAKGSFRHRSIRARSIGSWVLALRACFFIHPGPAIALCEATRCRSVPRRRGEDPWLPVGCAAPISVFPAGHRSDGHALMAGRRSCGREAPEGITSYNWALSGSMVRRYDRPRHRAPAGGWYRDGVAVGDGSVPLAAKRGIRFQSHLCLPLQALPPLTRRQRDGPLPAHSGAQGSDVGEVVVAVPGVALDQAADGKHAVFRVVERALQGCSVKRAQ